MSTSDPFHVTEPAATADPARSLPAIALVGRPNVGKSTLFNRLTGKRQALVSTVPGTTRDRREGQVERWGYRFRLVDTGGMAFGMGLDFSREVEAQVERAVGDADYLWVLLDAKEGLNPFDEQLVRWARRAGKPFRVVVNKADNPRRRAALAEFYALGTEPPAGISAEHGLGVDDLLAETAAALPAMRAGGGSGAPAPDAPWDDTPEEEAGEPRVPMAAGPLRVAFVGRPNVGKSSLVNRALGQARMIVSDQPGTTREAVETAFQLDGEEFILVDTAGIRRRSKTQEHLEKLGVLHSLGSLAWVQVAVLVVDAAGEVATQDARIASYVLEHRRAVVVAMNKWDEVGGSAGRAKEVEQEVRERLRFLPFARFVRTSALDGSGVTQLFREVTRAAEQFRREIQTADLNRVVQAAAVRFPPPAQRGAPTRIYYGTQVGTEPPAFRFFTNHPKQIDESYTRYFEGQLRHHFGLEGTPLRIAWRARRREENRAADSRRQPRRAGAGAKAAGPPKHRTPRGGLSRSRGKGRPR